MEQFKVYSKEELKGVQEHLVDILIKIDSICEKHNINYFAIGGTLLGAIRHKGFIPWDDDIDIGMMRKDYDHFLKIASEELSENYFVLNYETNKNVPFSFTKVCKKDTLFVEYEVRKLNYPHTLFVDIIPFDKCPSDDNKQKKYLKRMLFWHQLFKSKTLWRVSKLANEKRSSIGKIARPILHILLLPISKKYIYKKMIKNMTKYNQDSECEKVCCWGGKKTMELITSYLPTRKMKFEQIQINTPNNSDLILKTQYGDYMQLPPENKRHSHMPYELKL